MPDTHDGSYYSPHSGYHIDGHTFRGQEGAVIYLRDNCFMAPQEAVMYCRRLDEQCQKDFRAYMAVGRNEFNHTGVKELVRRYSCRNKEALKEIPFTQWADAWYADLRHRIMEDTHWQRKRYLDQPRNYFGDKPVSEITESDVEAFCEHAKFELDASVYEVYLHRVTLSNIFGEAVKYGLIEESPAPLEPYNPSCKPVYRRNSLTEDEVAILREKLPENIIKHCILLMIGSGIRIKELLALTREDIAPDGSYLDVNKVCRTVFHHTPIVTHPADDQDIRIVYVLPDFQSSAVYLREHGGDKFVLTSSRENGLFTSREFHGLYNTVMESVPGVPFFPPTDCRRTHFVLYDTAAPLEDILSDEGDREENLTHEISDTPAEDSSPISVVIETQPVHVEEPAIPDVNNDEFPAVENVTTPPAIIASSPTAKKTPDSHHSIPLPDTIWKNPTPPHTNSPVSIQPSHNKREGLERTVGAQTKESSASVFGFQAGDRIRYFGIGLGVITKMIPLRNGDAMAQINFANSQKSGRYMMKAAARLMQKI